MSPARAQAYPPAYDITLAASTLAHVFVGVAWLQSFTCEQVLLSVYSVISLDIIMALEAHEVPSELPLHLEVGG